MNKAYSYIRFSRPEQLRGDSLRRQLEASRKYAEEHGLELVEEMADLGVSAFRGKHAQEGALGRFLRLVKQGEIEPGSTLLVESLDRLSRERPDDALEQLLGILRAGIKVATLLDQQVYDRKVNRTTIGPLMVSLAIMSRAHDESKSKADRLTAAWDAKRARAREQGKTVTARVPAWLRRRGDAYVLDEQRAIVVKQIVEWTAAGVGRALIAKRLNEQGVPPFGKGHGWHDSAVQKILDNHAAIGVYRPYRKDEDGRRVPEGAPIPNVYPAVVPEDLWWAAQDARRRRRGTGGRTAADGPHVLTGLCRCGACGGTMMRVNKGTGPKGGTYLRCDNAARGAGCANRKLWRYDAVERAVMQGIGRADLARVLAQPSDASDSADRVAGLEARIADAEKRRERWGVLLEEGDEHAVAQVRHLTAEIKTARRELEAARREEAQHRATDASPADRQAQVACLHAALTDPGVDLDARRLLRARLNQELRRVIGRIEFRPSVVSLIWDAAAAPARASALALPAGHSIPVLFAGDAGQVEAEASASGVELDEEVPEPA